MVERARLAGLMFAFVAVANLIAGTSLHAQATPEKRVALVIGNSAYTQVSRLENPANDATDIAMALERIGFGVTTRLDLDYRSMRLALRDFSEASAEADMALVYFAGHGIEIDNTNYLIPTNAELRSDRDVEFEAIRLDTVIGTIADVDGLKIVLVDACRNNPFLNTMTRTSGTRSIGRGLGRIDPGGVLVGYAARGGTLALDGDGRNSPYARAILQHIEEPGLELGKMFRKVRDTVFSLTKGYQEPFTYGSLPGNDIFLVPPIEAAMVGQDPEIAASLSVAQRMMQDFAAADGEATVAGWTRFLNRYASNPNTALLDIARARRTALAKPSAAQEPEPPATVAAPQPSPPKQAATPEPQKRPEDELVVSRNLARSVQAALNTNGFNAGSPDGVLGPKSRGAIEKFQAARGLPATGALDRETLAALAIDPAKPTVDRSYSVSGRSAQRYTVRTAPEADSDPRLKRALQGLKGRDIVYGYFRGNLYIAVVSQGHFNDARSMARRIGGHLATITSRAENDFVYELVRYDSRFWDLYEDRTGASGPLFGLYQAQGASEPRGGWQWVTGEAFRYNNWARYEPNDHKGREDYANFAYWSPGKAPMSGVRTGKLWNDSPGYSASYVIEFD